MKLPPLKGEWKVIKVIKVNRRNLTQIDKLYENFPYDLNKIREKS
jgi:hypothetical protein